MYIWNVNALAEDLKAGRVNSREQLKYIIFFNILLCLSIDPFLHVGRPYTLYDFLITAGSICLAVWGICHCYAKNHEGDDADFILRYTCLGTPIFIRYFLIILGVFLFLALAKVMFGILTGAENVNAQFNHTDALDTFFALSMQFVYYFYLGNKIGQVASQPVVESRETASPRI